MGKGTMERRRVLQLFTLGSLAVPAVVLSGCTMGAGNARAPRNWGGGNNGGEKSGGGGGIGGGGGRAGSK